MRRAALGFLLGITSVQQLATLPEITWSLLLVILIPAAIRCSRWRLWIAIPIGFFWASLIANILMSNGLDPRLEGQDVIITGLVASLPEQHERQLRFLFKPETLQWQGREFPPPQKLTLNWYSENRDLQIGERWRLRVRLKRPHGFMNPGGFDYEAWLFSQGIRARGYVRNDRDGAHPVNQRLSAAQTHWVGQFRQHLRDNLNEVLANAELSGLVLALAMGDRQQISDRQWEVLTRTGTSHLVAISGLHVGLVAGFAFFLIGRLWRLSARATVRYPAAKVGALAGLVAALGYSLLAGFSIPTQRALVMVAVVMAGLLLQRKSNPSGMLSLALIVVLILDPLAVMSAGFWLSFVAIAVIFYGMQGRITRDHNPWRRTWWRWGRVQWVVALGLLPVLLLLFDQVSLVAPLANVFAVPWVSLVTVPLTLLGTVLLGFGDWPAQWLFALAVISLDVMWYGLVWLADLEFAQWIPADPPFWAIVSACVGIVWLMLPRGVPARWVGVFWLVPLMFSGVNEVPGDEARFTLLDVGQGLAAVIQTQHHVLVFDTGPKFPSGFNAGEAVLLPFLRSRGIRSIDTLIVSHGDNDHLGGVSSLLQEISAGTILTSAPEKLSNLPSSLCHTGIRWQWDGVWFEFLHPPRNEGSGISENNLSCVLRVAAHGERILLTGDIELEAEQQLVRRLGGELAADVLVVPHHGSTTSSSPAFVDTVSPRIVLFPVGYQNRFGFPKPQVVSRYQVRNAEVYDSASNGAIEISIGKRRIATKVTGYRQTAARYWHYQPLRRYDGDGRWDASFSQSTSLLQ